LANDHNWIPDPGCGHLVVDPELSVLYCHWLRRLNETDALMHSDPLCMAVAGATVSHTDAGFN